MPPWFAARMPRRMVLGLTSACTLCASACVTPSGGSVCGDDRPCVPEGVWQVQYFDGPPGIVLSRNRVQIFADGTAEVVDEVPRQDECPPDRTGPGELLTSATLSADGCNLEVFIDKSWCQSGEDHCDNRLIRLSFCEGGSFTVAGGAVRACICSLTGTPECDELEDNLVTRASAIRID